MPFALCRSQARSLSLSFILIFCKCGKSLLICFPGIVHRLYVTVHNSILRRFDSFHAGEDIPTNLRIYFLTLVIPILSPIFFPISLLMLTLKAWPVWVAMSGVMMASRVRDFMLLNPTSPGYLTITTLHHSK